MANNRMFLVHVPTGKSVYIARQSGVDWYALDGEHLENALNMLFAQAFESGELNNFALTMEDTQEVPNALPDDSRHAQSKVPKLREMREKIMKIQIPTTKEVEVIHVRVSLPVRYEEEDIPNNAPMRSGDMWNASIEIDTGQILDWPKGKSLDLSMKVCDSGHYELLSGHEVIAEIQDYVPHGVIPGEYGDYVNLDINSDGIITNWPSNPDVSAFFPDL